jgi:4-diphosphocytidyl-2-C-methyl-D-erythritol kinase
MPSIFVQGEKKLGAAAESLPSLQLNPELINDCEPIVRMLYPAVDQALNWLNQYANARLTGTGACVFASFLDLDSAESVMKQMPSDYQGFIAQGMDHSLTHEQLYNCINK